MAHVSQPLHGDEQHVTASELVRQFGLWQERAGRAPVYVLHRGRPRLVLTSVDLMDALCAPHAQPALSDDAMLNAVLDARDEIALLLDARGRVRLASHAARARYGTALSPGASVGRLAALGGDLLEDAVARVLAGGIAETVEVVPPRFDDRRLLCAVAPLPDGCIVRARDISAEEALAEARALAQATHAASESAGAIAVRVSLRGNLVDPPAALAGLVGIAPETLGAARLAALFEVADRVAIGEAVERAAGGAAVDRLDARLLVRGSSALATRVGMAAIRIAGRVEGLAAMIVPAP